MPKTCVRACKHDRIPNSEWSLHARKILGYYRKLFHFSALSPQKQRELWAMMRGSPIIALFQLSVFLIRYRLEPLGARLLAFNLQREVGEP